MLRLYSIATFVISLLLFPLFLLRARGRARLLERYGRWNLELDDCIWFHGASVGEINGLLPIIARVRGKFPGLPVLLTATSVTGLNRGQGRVDYLRLVPFDNAWWIRRALDHIQPRAFVFGESEMWPALLDYLQHRRIRRYLVNARISEATAARYRTMGVWLRPMVRELDLICAASETYAARFVGLGAAPEKVFAIGNAKYDQEAPLTTEEVRATVRAELAPRPEPVLVLGSLRPGEEAFWFDALRQFNESAEAIVQVIVAPRHSEKFEYFAKELTKRGIRFSRRSEGAPPTESVLLLDSLGELLKAYSIADAAFVGATLVDLGGHNPLEPAMFGACVALGPYTDNVADVMEALFNEQAYVPMRDTRDILEFIRRVARRDPTLSAMGARAQTVWHSFRGASQRVLDALDLSR